MVSSQYIPSKHIFYHVYFRHCKKLNEVIRQLQHQKHGAKYSLVLWTRESSLLSVVEERQEEQEMQARITWH